MTDPIERKEISNQKWKQEETEKSPENAVKKAATEWLQQRRHVTPMEAGEC